MASENVNITNKTVEPPRLVLHSINRGKTCPSVSPYVLKLETYLKMAEIPYKIDTSKPFGAKGKTPWITIDGEDVADSQLIIEYLNKKLNKNLWRNATIEQKAVSQAMRVMLEERFLCGLAEWRWVTDVEHLDEILDWSGIKLWFIKKVVSRRVKSNLYTQGIGRHSPEDQLLLLTGDLRAVSNYLGDKPFFLGDEPTEIDCSIFGVMAQYVYCAPRSPFEKMINDEFPNIKQYCARMMERFWADWDKSDKLQSKI